MSTDWDDAYANAAYIEGGGSYPGRWARAAEACRARLHARGQAELDIAYGPGPRQRFDLFRPEGPAKGLVTFFHGGYWLAFDKSSWSHLAQGAIDRGWAVAVPSYRLAPGARVGEITRDAALAVSAAADRVAGPLRLAGHSAGGHLVTRMACRDAPLPQAIQSRIARVISISGLHDLRPLLHTKMAYDLFGSSGEAADESPVLHEPMHGLRLTCWTGEDERPEFLRQSALLANIWSGLGAVTDCVHAPGQHHFNVIDGLADRSSPLVNALLGQD